MVFERLLRATGPQGDRAKRDILLLDRVLEDAKQLRGSSAWRIACGSTSIYR